MAEGPVHARSVGLEKVSSELQKRKPIKKDTHNVHTLPAVVFTKSLGEATTVGREPISEVLGTSSDIVTLEASHEIFMAS